MAGAETSAELDEGDEQQGEGEREQQAVHRLVCERCATG
ncbi:hypothetical protein ATK36_2883 [Amycolatopsis sulphurea]|uniref:Uncharacterized protein n=1 Tax=Amycolatopsis sulphurea TaxID=76022 RepID=A0A2A9F9I1_9PSEU|nr:hypothetical protein ATK36_2883 [Amycolatopsis sulphurea]